MMTDRCSVVIRADHTDQRILGQLLDRLNRQSDVKLENAVLVDSSPEGYPLEVATFDWLLVERLRREAFSYGRALNRGCQAARGDLLVILNGHTIPIGTSWLRDLTRPLEDPSIAGVCGLQNSVWPNSRELEPTVLTATNFGPPAWRGLGTTNLALRRELWEKFPFDEEVEFAEDKEWGRRVVLAGYQILLGVEASIHHMHPERRLGQSLRREFESARTEARFALTGGVALSSALRRFLGELARAPWKGLTSFASHTLRAGSRLLGNRAGRKS